MLMMHNFPSDIELVCLTAMSSEQEAKRRKKLSKKKRAAFEISCVACLSDDFIHSTIVVGCSRGESS